LDIAISENGEIEENIVEDNAPSLTDEVVEQPEVAEASEPAVAAEVAEVVEQPEVAEASEPAVEAEVAEASEPAVEAEPVLIDDNVEPMEIVEEFEVAEVVDDVLDSVEMDAVAPELTDEWAEQPEGDILTPEIDSEVAYEPELVADSIEDLDSTYLLTDNGPVDSVLDDELIDALPVDISEDADLNIDVQVVNISVDDSAPLDMMDDADDLAGDDFDILTDDNFDDVLI
ncbi:MAG: hypothetical protein IJB56_03505, partial [Alistipes sp.]|nr:hypothetical protein [Alistipes sp.]